MKSTAGQLVGVAVKKARRRGVTISEADARELIAHVFELLENHARLIGPAKTAIGTFQYVTHKARPIVDPQTGKTIKIPAQRKLKFTAMPRFRGLR